MAIQWFPGHMTSARKQAAETMARIDVVIEVLDARVPEAGSNPLINELRLHRQRPCLKILNKTDLADPAATKAWLNFYNAQKDVKAVALSCKKPGRCHQGAGSVSGARPPSRHQPQAAAHDDHGHPQRRQIHADECAAEAPRGPGRR